MKPSYFIFILLIKLAPLSSNDLSFLRELQTNYIQCGKFQCPADSSKCSGKYSETCSCSPHYASYPFDTNILCSYYKKIQLYAFLLELFLMFGIGHFYLGNYTHAILKAIFFLLGYFLFIILRTMSKKTEENNTFTLLTALFGCMICVGMLIWQIIDVILLGLGKYTDGNGVELYFMGY